MHTRRTLALALALVSAAGIGAILAGDAQGQNAPTYSGRSLAAGLVGPAGGVFVLEGVRGEPRLVLPPGLAQGEYRFTFGAEDAVDPEAVRPGFTAMGPALRFSHALDATASPIELSFRAAPAGAGTRHVLATEYTTLCEEEDESQSVICVRWAVQETSYAAGRVRARLPVTEGRRMQFGTLPATSPGES